MVFVPMVHRPEVSPRAEELARRINEAITAYRSAHPDLTSDELQQAMMRAAMNAGPGASGSGAQRPALLAGLLAMVVSLGVVLFMFTRDRGDGPSWPVVAILIGVLAVAAVIFTIRRSSS